MATFLPGVTDTFPQQVLFQPDYNFLSMVQGTKQAQYDRSLSSIRNMYSSLFNAPLGNGENREYRDRIHKQIQNQLKTLPGLDLSKSQNITAAQQVFDPLVNDQEIMKDMSEVQAAQRELQISERFRLSEKAEERALYNPTSVQDINNNMQNLAEAKRGDGSIMQIQSRKYVPFFDSNKYLADLQKQEGLKTQTTYKDGQGYIIEMVNGKGAVEPFTQWARARLNNPQAQQYFGVLGRVNAENQIRGISQQTGAPKEEVRQLLAEGIREGMIAQKTEEGLVYQKQLRDIEFAKGQYKKAYPDGKIPVSEQKTFESVLGAEETYKNALEGVEQELLEMASGEISHVASNLESIYGQQAADQAAGTWASTHALGTSEEHIKTDDVLLKKWDLDYKYKDLAQTRELAIMREQGEQSRFDTRLKFDYKMKELDYKKALELEKIKEFGMGYEGVAMGYSAVQQTGTAVDSFSKSQDATFTEAYTKAFSYNGSLRGIVGDDRYNRMSSTLGKVRKIAQGGEVEITDADLQNLINLGAELDVQVVNPANASDARTMLNKLFSGVYKRTEELITKDPTQKGAANTEKLANNNGQLFAAMSAINDQTQALNKTAEAFSDYIAPGGQKRAGFENVPELYRIGNRPVYDLSKLTPEQKAELSKIAPDEFKNMSSAVGMTYSFPGMKDYELETIMSPNILTSISVDNDNVTQEYSANQMSSFTKALNGVRGEDLSKLFGESVTATYDPASKQVLFSLKVNPASPVAGKLDALDGKTGELKIAVPYETVLATPGLSRFHSKISTFTPDNRKLGFTEPLLEEFGRTLQLPRRYSQFGITGYVRGDINENDNPILILKGEYNNNGVVKPFEKTFDIGSDIRQDLSEAERNMEQFLQTLSSKTAEQQRSNTTTEETFTYKF